MIQVAPTLSPPVDYSVRFGNDIQDFPESSCDASICRHVFITSLSTADEFQLVVIVSNGLGNGQSVTFPTSGEHVRSTCTFQGSIWQCVHVGDSGI